MFTKESKYLLLITIIFIGACIETDIYLPAFTDMMEYFSISEGQIQSLLTWNFIGICVSGPLYGPISDAIGRRKPLLIALGLFLMGSLITVFAEDYQLMLLGRVLQGLGSGGCFTLGTAILFDVFQQEQAVIALNKLNVIIPVVMAGAPMLGGYLNETFGFRSNFLAITLCVLVSLAICLSIFEESLPKEKRVPFEAKKLLKDFMTVFSSLPFWQTTLIVSLLFAGYLAFLSTMSVLFVLEFGVSKQALPYHQAALLGGWVGASLIYKRCLTRWGLVKIKVIGASLCVLGGLGFVMGAWLTSDSIYLFTGMMTLYAIGGNWINSIYFPEGMEIYPHLKGITASLLTSARLLITAVLVGFTSHMYDSSIYPVAEVIFGIVLTILTTLLLYESRRVKHPAVQETVPVVEIF